MLVYAGKSVCNANIPEANFWKKYQSIMSYLSEWCKYGLIVLTSKRLIV